MGAHTDLPPSPRPDAHARAEVQRHGEPSIADRHALGAHRGANCPRAARGVLHGRLKSERALGHACAAIEPAQTGERRALGLEGVVAAEEENPGRECDERFHLFKWLPRLIAF